MLLSVVLLSLAWSSLLLLLFRASSSADVFNRVREPFGIRERNARTVLFRATGAQLLACKRRQCRRMLLSLVIGSYTTLHVAVKGKGKTVQ